MIYLIKHESGNYMDCDWKWKVVISESSKLHINVWVDLQNWIEQMEMVEKKEYGPLHSTAVLLIISDYDRKPKWKRLTCYEMFSFVFMSLKFCKGVVFWQKSKPIQTNYLLSKPKLIKHSMGRKETSFAKVQPSQRHEEHKLFSLAFLFRGWFSELLKKYLWYI